MRIYDPDVAAGADTVDFSMWNFKPVFYEMPHPFFDISCISWSILMLASQSFTNVNTDVLLLRWCDPLQHMLLLFNLHIFAILHALTERVRQLDRVYRLKSESLFSVWKAILTIHDSFFLSTKTLDNSSMSRAVQFSSRIARLQSPHFYNINVTRRIAQHHPTSGLVDIVSLQCINPNPIRFEKKVWMMRWYL